MSRPTRFHMIMPFRVRGYHPVSPAFPERSTNVISYLRASPRSLAATEGISVDFFSSGYLDVSVLPVRLVYPMYSDDDTADAGGFPHSDISGYNASYRLPRAFRRLARPSSPLTAKASTVYA